MSGDNKNQNEVEVMEYTTVKAEFVCIEERKLLKSCKRRIGHLSQLCLLDSGMFTRASGQYFLKDKPVAFQIACNILDELHFNASSNQKSEESISKVNSSESDTTLKRRSTYSVDERALCLARFQRHLTDYLFTSGQPLSALKFAQEKAELGDLCMMEVFDEAVSIEKALLEGDTGPAFSWLQEANFKLKKNDSYYEFDLRVFEFYLLVKQGKRIEAIQ
ncbi:unnamed protein product [Schistosoma mattheei]|uniref:Uncharacterized protein n=1 Tax=Schistosoma mattheei TaxID=31246 RepID=A0A183PNG0_9TREM|nr:unnamed protein product [Schistosoma mattheei]